MNRTITEATKRAFDFERDDLIACWKNNVLWLEKRLSGQRPYALLDGKTFAKDAMRKFHDRLGWKAYGNVRCSGALYRSLNFVDMPVEKRDEQKAVHIEHTVPIKQLNERWRDKRPHTQDNAERLRWLLENSITTAMLPQEARDYIQKRHNSDNECFHQGQAYGLPFRRYGSMPILNAVTGKLIDPGVWSLTDHWSNMMRLLQDLDTDVSRDVRGKLRAAKTLH